MPLVPNTPYQILTGSLASTTSILVEWDPVADTTIPNNGYLLYMDGGNDGNFNLIYDGTNSPGKTSYLVKPTIPGQGYRFYVVALNFNGKSDASSEALLYSCLPPSSLAPPTYVSSTTTTLTVAWTAPHSMNGCPL